MENPGIYDRWNQNPIFLKVKKSLEEKRSINYIFEESQIKWEKIDDKFDLRGINLKNIDLSNFDFTNCDLSSSIFEKCYLVNTQFIGCVLSRSQFEDCSLRSSVFKNTICAGSLFYKINLCKATFCSSNFSDCKFEDSTLHKIKINKSTLPHLINFLNRPAPKSYGIRIFFKSKIEISTLILLFITCGFYVQSLKTYDLLTFLAYTILCCLPFHILTRIYKIRFAKHRTHTGWLKEELNENYAGASYIYLQLKLFYKSTGDLEQAAKSHYRHSINLRKTLALHKRLKIYFINEFILGYGEKPIRVLRFSLILILLFSSYYYKNDNYTLNIRDENSTQETAIITAEPATKRHRLDIYEAIYFSTVTFATLGYGDITPNFRSNEETINTIPSFKKYVLPLMVPALEAVLGCIMIATFVVVLGRRLIRDY